jgi:hypothetical protein
MKRPSFRQGTYATYDGGRPGGGADSIIIADTTQRLGSFYCLRTLTATVFNANTKNARDVGVAASTNFQSNGYGTISIPAGVDLFGDFSAVQLVSGAVQAFVDTEPGAQPVTPTAATQPS